MGNAVRINRRGACPALAAPMETGDGLLARLNPVREGLSLKQLTGLCESARKRGNGIIEITSRGSLQLRGLTHSSAAALAQDVNDLSIEVRTGTSVATGPLAGLDPLELIDPRPLADAIRNGISKRGMGTRLGPKVSVIVDGGGLWNADPLQADIRCNADVSPLGPLWNVTIGGDASGRRTLGSFGDAEAAVAALRVLEELARRGPPARARDLVVGACCGDDAHKRHVTNPLGRLPLKNDKEAVAVALPLGSIDADTLEEFAQRASDLGATEFRPAAPRTLIVLLEAPTSSAVTQIADELGLIANSEDPMMRIFACPGAPACTFGHFETRNMARAIADNAKALFEDRSVSLHVSGCAKGCAHPAHATLTLVGDEKSVGIVVGGTARSLPVVHSRPKPLAEAMRRLAERLGRGRTAQAVSRLEPKELSALFRQGRE